MRRALAEPDAATHRAAFLADHAPAAAALRAKEDLRRSRESKDAQPDLPIDNEDAVAHDDRDEADRAE